MTNRRAKNQSRSRTSLLIRYHEYFDEYEDHELKVARTFRKGRHCPETKLNSDLATISNWFSSNLLTLNISKCNFVILGNSRKLKLVNDVSLKVNSTAIDKSDSFKYLGVAINQTVLVRAH